MPISSRRGFLAASAVAAAAPFAADLRLLAPLGHAAAADTRVAPGGVRSSATVEGLVRLIHVTPRERCIPVFIEELRAGMSYQDFLAALFLATIDEGDPHPVAGIYSAHRVSSEARAEERLLPLFWALDRIAGVFGGKEPKQAAALAGEMPSAGRAAGVFRQSMAALDPDTAERAIIAHARSAGARQALSLLWEHSARRASGTLGHHPIMAASTIRTLEALGWQHAEPVLRYLARAFTGSQSDRSYQPNLERVQRALPALPAGWASRDANRGATLELYRVLRDGDTDAACDLACAQLVSGVRAGAVWDAVHLVAADLLFRYRTGGGEIGGYLIHCVTSTNALRCGFEASGEDRVRLLLLLQGVAVLGNLYVDEGRKRDELRPLSLLDLKADEAAARTDIPGIFAMLPRKGDAAAEAERDRGRPMSDEAARVGFDLLQRPENQIAFKRSALGFLCAKATSNPHDLKYPVAGLEDAAAANTEWRPYLYAASLHALHGAASPDSAFLVQAREALG